MPENNVTLYEHARLRVVRRAICPRCRTWVQRERRFAATLAPRIDGKLREEVLSALEAEATAFKLAPLVHARCEGMADAVSGVIDS